MEVDIHDEREAKQKFYDDKSFNSLRVLLFYMMEELLIQKYVGWKFDMKESVEYPKPILEWYDHVINQLWYYFDYKYQKHTVGLFDFVELNISYQTQNIKDQLAILDKKYEGIEEITHKTIGEICGEIHKDVLMPMTELTKYNSEYVTRNMRMIFYLMILVLITGLLIPMISQYLNTQMMVANILGFISIASIGISIIWLVFSLKEMIYEELNTA